MGFKKNISLILKGAGMGAANVIPGVSGGTVALITGIFEELIDSIKSINMSAAKLLVKGEFREFVKRTNLLFLVQVFLGVAISIISLAKLLEWLFEKYPVYVWAYFFGLILASVFFVGKTIHKWSIGVLISMIIGTAVAVSISFLNPATENDGFLYLTICGVVAICSMILPGLSGSFVLILMGNYELVVIDAVVGMRFEILIPVILGAGIGLFLFSHLLSWVYKKYRDQTISLLTGFILGSLLILWPWKKEKFQLDELGNILVKEGEEVIAGYEPYLPSEFNIETMMVILFIILGIATIWFVEKTALNKSK